MDKGLYQLKMWNMKKNQTETPEIVYIVCLNRIKIKERDRLKMVTTAYTKYYFNRSIVAQIIYHNKVNSQQL